jgi:hypothetical protein
MGLARGVDVPKLDADGDMLESTIDETASTMLAPRRLPQLARSDLPPVHGCSSASCRPLAQAGLHFTEEAVGTETAASESYRRVLFCSDSE